MILEHQILILEWFVKGHVTLKTGVMMLWSQELITLYWIFTEKTDDLHYNNISPNLCKVVYTFHCDFVTLRD